MPISQMSRPTTRRSAGIRSIWCCVILLGSDVNRLTTLFAEVCELHRDHRDYTRQEISRALRELVACFPIYRTYVVPERNEITGDDERYVNEAVEAAEEIPAGDRSGAV